MLMVTHCLLLSYDNEFFEKGSVKWRSVRFIEDNNGNNTWNWFSEVLRYLEKKTDALGYKGFENALTLAQSGKMACFRPNIDSLSTLMITAYTLDVF